MSFLITPNAEASVTSLVRAVNKTVINPLIIFIFALAFVYFMFGIVQYLINSDNEEVRKKSKSHMLWGIVGMFIMISVFGIMNLLLNTIGEHDIQIQNNGNYTVGDIQ